MGNQSRYAEDEKMLIIVPVICYFFVFTGLGGKNINLLKIIRYLKNFLQFRWFFFFSYMSKVKIKNINMKKIEHIYTSPINFIFFMLVSKNLLFISSRISEVSFPVFSSSCIKGNSRRPASKPTK